MTKKDNKQFHSAIKAIIFDYGEVLNAPEDTKATQKKRALLAKQLNLDPDELWTYLFEGEPAKLWMTGKLTWDEFWSAVLAPRGINDPVEVQEFALKCSTGNNALNSEMVDLLKQLKGRYKLAILSNASWTEEELTNMLQDKKGLPEGVIDEVITSSSVGVTKPNELIYLTALERLGVAPQEVIFTDDLKNFTAAAARLGIHTHTFTSPAGLYDYLGQMGIISLDG